MKTVFQTSKNDSGPSEEEEVQAVTHAKIGL